MSVDVVLVALAIGLSLCVLAAGVWALTRADDRIQLATACLFISSLGYAAAAAGLWLKGGNLAPAGVLLAFYAAVVYLVMAVLAISFARWAWQAAAGAFGVHLLMSLLASGNALQHGAKGAAGLVIWFLVGAVGLWALLHPGSRALVTGMRERVT